VSLYGLYIYYYHVAENGSHLSAEKGGNQIVAEFDEQFRLTKLNGQNTNK